MQNFVAVIEAGSFVHAAEALHSSKAAVSRHISELESRLGVRLLHRTTRKLSLTEEGEVFFERCKELLSNLDEAEAEITSRKADASGLLRINVPVSYGIRVLAPLWGEFHRLYPRVKLDVELADRTVDLVEEGYDLAIRIASLPNSTLVSKQLTSTRIMLCASPQYIKQHGEPLKPGELKHHQLIGYTYWSLKDEWVFEGPQGQERVKTTPFMRTNNGDTCLAAALEGEGIILQPSFLVADALKNGQLIELMPNYRSIELGIYAVYPTRKYVSPKVRVLIDFLTKYFQQGMSQQIKKVS